ncbi:MAG: VOC family protein [Deltaproteobacteria bacterium]|nr:VOC family protein [Deltaproteobacteria bacterium]
MFDHIGVKVKDVEESARFYKAALGALGLVCSSQDASGAGFGPQGAPALWLNKSKEKAGGAHLAFKAKDRKAVDRFHAAGLDAGGKDNGKPGVRKDYAPNYYAAFLLDPDGNNIEAVCFKD